MLAGKDKDDNDVAVINMDETNLSHPGEYSWRELREMVRQYADALKSSGLKHGEVVARKYEKSPCC